MFEPIQLNSRTPKRIDPRVRKLLVAMELDEGEAIWLDLARPKAFVPERNECHINSRIQQKYEGGSVGAGWTIWQDKTVDFVEAQFHTVWRDTMRLLRDVTPRQHGERQILFIPDRKRNVLLISYSGLPAIITYDNVRMQDGVLANSFQEQTHILTTKLIYTHGLASRGSAEA